MRRALVAAAAAAFLLPASPAAGSMWVASTTATTATLKIDAAGDAEVGWKDATGTHSRLVFPNGTSKPEHHLSAPDVSKRASAAGLPMAVTVRRTPDGLLWALQSWQVLPGKPPELHLSRWRGAPTKVTAEAVCCKFGSETIEGTATFAGKPVFGRSPTAGGPVREVAYVDRLAGGAWQRMQGVFPHAGDGLFRLFVKPVLKAPRYRVTIAGPNRGTTLAPDARVAFKSSQP
jgi:hypothetical protein